MSVNRCVVYAPSIALFTLAHATPTCLLTTAPLTCPPCVQPGYTALHVAVMWGKLETVRLLLDSGANKEAKDKVRGESSVDRGCVAVR